MDPASVHSVAKLFSYGARLTAAQASYVEVEISPYGEELTVYRAWSAGDDDAVYCPVGLMCHVDLPRDYLEPAPDPDAVARVLAKRKHARSYHVWGRELAHFARNWDAGRYRGRLDVVLGIDLTVAPPRGMVDSYGRSILGGWAAPGWQPYGTLTAGISRRDGRPAHPNARAEG